MKIYIYFPRTYALDAPVKPDTVKLHNQNLFTFYYSNQSIYFSTAKLTNS